MVGNQRVDIEALIKESKHREKHHHKIAKSEQQWPPPSAAFQPEDTEANDQNHARHVRNPPRSIDVPLWINHGQVKWQDRLVQIKPRHVTGSDNPRGETR